MTHPLIHPNPWQNLKTFTSARIALGRAGDSLPTHELLAFGLAHAEARDAVHQPLDFAELTAGLAAIGLDAVQLHSAASDRLTYLRRPDLGRMLDNASRDQLLQTTRAPVDLALVIADGLSSTAVQRQVVPFLHALLPRLRQIGIGWSAAMLAEQGRVAIGDDIGEALQARAVLVMIGERPGLSSPDSLGLYMTWGPKIGRLDSERNCISNVRPEGLPPTDAAYKQAWLLEQAFQRQLTGIGLKDESGQTVILSNATDQNM